MKKVSILIFLFIVKVCFVPVFSQEFHSTDSLEKLLYLTHENSKRIEVYSMLAELYIYNNPEKALEYADQAFRLADRIGDENGQLLSLITKAKAYQIKTDLVHSFQCANKALEVSMRTGKQHERAMSILIIAWCYRDLGDYQMSAESCFEALEIFESLDDKEGVANALNTIGNSYFDQGDTEKSYDFYKQALEISREINNKSGIARGLNNIADYYSIKNEPEKVIYHYSEAVLINREIGQLQWEGINYMNIGDVYLSNNELDSALLYLEKAITIFETLNNIPNLNLAYLEMADYYVARGDVHAGIKQTLRAYNLVKDKHLLRFTYMAAFKLHEFYKQEGDLENAYHYSQIQYHLKDSLETEKSLAHISQLDLEAEFDKINQEEVIQQQRKAYLFRTTIIIVIFISISIIFLIYALLKIRVKKIHFEKQRLEVELEYKNKELTAKVMSLAKKNELITEISKKLRQVEKDAVKDEIKAGINSIVGELHKSKDKDVWEEFNVRFKEVHNDFYLRLMKSYPDLSPAEQRLCAFLKLNLSTKDISELTGLQFRSIENARSKLRKKLGITNPKESLVSFLSKF